VRRSNFIIIKNVVMWTVAIVALFIILPIQDMISPDEITARKFCAYGQVYVEFHSNSKTWGTTFLDNRGRPVSCDEEENNVKEQTTTRENI